MLKGSSMGSRYLETSGKVSGEGVVDGFLSKPLANGSSNGFSIGDNVERFVCIFFHNGNLYDGCFTKYCV